MALKEYLRIGEIAGQARMRIVQPGADILAPGFDDLIFDSVFSTMRLRQSGAITFTQPNVPEPVLHGASESIEWDDEGYIPFVLLAATSPNNALAWYGANITGGGFYDSRRLWWTGGENMPGDLAKALMPYMFYDESSGNGGYDKFGFDAVVTATGMTVTSHFRPIDVGHQIVINYYVFDISIVDQGGEVPDFPFAVFREGRQASNNASTYTFNDVDIGDGHETRRLVIGVAGSNFTSPSSVSISIDGGSAISPVAISRAAALFITDVIPTGDSADVQVNFSNGQQECLLAVWSATGLESAAPLETASSFGSSHSATLTTEEQGLIFSFASLSFEAPVENVIQLNGINTSWASTASSSYLTVARGGMDFDTPDGELTVGASLSSGSLGFAFVAATFR